MMRLSLFSAQENLGKTETSGALPVPIHLLHPKMRPAQPSQPLAGSRKTLSASWVPLDVLRGLDKHLQGALKATPPQKCVMLVLFPHTLLGDVKRQGKTHSWLAHSAEGLVSLVVSPSSSTTHLIAQEDLEEGTLCLLQGLLVQELGNQNGLVEPALPRLPECLFKVTLHKVLQPCHEFSFSLLLSSFPYPLFFFFNKLCY